MFRLFLKLGCDGVTRVPNTEVLEGSRIKALYPPASLVVKWYRRMKTRPTQDPCRPTISMIPPHYLHSSYSRTAVSSFWGHTRHNLCDSYPNRDCGPKQFRGGGLWRYYCTIMGVVAFILGKIFESAMLGVRKGTEGLYIITLL